MRSRTFVVKIELSSGSSVECPSAQCSRSDASGPGTRCCHACRVDDHRRTHGARSARKRAQTSNRSLPNDRPERNGPTGTGHFETNDHSEANSRRWLGWARKLIYARCDAPVRFTGVMYQCARAVIPATAVRQRPLARSAAQPWVPGTEVIFRRCRHVTRHRRRPNCPRPTVPQVQCTNASRTRDWTQAWTDRRDEEGHGRRFLRRFPKGNPRPWPNTLHTLSTGA